MKRFILAMVAVLTLGSAANAMSYKSARDQAFFLTDKMAFELGLSDDQYNAVFEINMDYIMCLDVYDDIFGTFWTRRNNELKYVLSPMQYQRYLSPSITTIPRTAIIAQLLLDTRCIRVQTVTLTTVLTTVVPLALPTASRSPSPVWVVRSMALPRVSLAARASPA